MHGSATDQPPGKPGGAAYPCRRPPRLGAGPPRSSHSLSRHVQRELERLITEGELQPGERLNEVALAKRLGVSRGPVREAARALEKSGLVTVIVKRGAFVRALTLDEAMDIYELNAVIFGLAAGQLAVSITAAQALELQALVDGMDRAGAASDPDAFFDLNVRFHQDIMRLARNRQAEAVYGDFTKKLLLFRRRSRPGGQHAAVEQRAPRPCAGARRGRGRARAGARRAPRPCPPCRLGAIEHEGAPLSGDRVGHGHAARPSRRRAHA